MLRVASVIRMPCARSLLEQPQVALLAVGRAVGRADVDGAAMLVHDILEPAHGLGGERVGGVEHDRAEAAAVAASHLMRG